MSIIVNIADSLVTALNGHSFSKPFTATRAYRPIFDLKDMGDLHVTVVPKSVDMNLTSRSAVIDDIQIDIGVQQKLSTASNEEIDALMDLVQEIVEFIRATGRLGNAIWVKTENTPIYSPEHLDKFRQFTSVLTLTFRVTL